MVDAFGGKAGFASRFRMEELSGYDDDGEFDTTIDDAYVPKFFEEYDEISETRERDGDFEGMIFMSNKRTKKECFSRKLFGLPSSYASTVKHVRPGMKLFLFEYERREMHGVFEANTCGAINIEPNAFKGSGRSFPAQVRFKRVWECYPLSEKDFKDAIFDNYRTQKEFDFELSHEQVMKLMDLFARQMSKSPVPECHDPLSQTALLHHDSLSQTALHHDSLSQTALHHETSRFFQELGRSMQTSDYHAGNTLYDFSDAEQKLASTREPVYKDLVYSGNCHVGQITCDDAEKRLAATRELVYKDLRGQGYFRSGQDVSDNSDTEQGLKSHTLQEFINWGKCDRLSSDFQPYYLKDPNFVENLRSTFAPSDAVTNSTNVSEQMYDNTREVFIPSIPHNDNIYYNETEMLHGSLPFDSLPSTLKKSLIEMPQPEDCEELRQVVPISKSAANKFSVCADYFQDDLPSHFMAQPKHSFPQPSYSGTFPTLSPDNCSQKPSVFSRLTRAPKMDVSYEKKHEHHLRQNHLAKLDHHKDRRKSFASDELEMSNKQDESMPNTDAGDEPLVDDRIVINFKRRSQICKSGEESTLQVEDQTKPSDGELTSHRQKRRKLIRPQFDMPKISEESAVPLSVQETVQTCNVEKKISTQPENCVTTINRNMMSVADSAANFQDMHFVNIMDATETKSLLTLCTMQDNNNHTRVPLSIRNVTEHADSSIGEATKEVENQDLTDSYIKECLSQLASGNTKVLDLQNARSNTEPEGSVNVKPGFKAVDEMDSKYSASLEMSETSTEQSRQECPCPLVSPSEKISTVENARCDCGVEYGVSANVTEHTNSFNVQGLAVDEVEGKDLANLNVNETLSEHRKECPSQLVCGSIENLDIQKAGCDVGEDNEGFLLNVAENADSSKVQAMDEVKTLDLSKPLTD